MTDDSFATIDAMLQEEVSASTGLIEENARLRALLAECDAANASHDASTLLVQLEAAQAEKKKLATEVRELRKAQIASVALEDQSSEVSVLRSSLADLALQLEARRSRADEAEARRREEVEKVNTLRVKVEESRRAIMRLQNEANRRPSIKMDYSFPPRRKSFLVDSAIPRRRSSLGLNAIVASQAAEEVKEPSNHGLGFAVESALVPPISLLSTSPSRSSIATPLARRAHRRGSASIAIQAEGLDDDDQRLLRFRELRLGVHSTKIASRRNSAVSGLPDFFQPEDFEWDLERSLARRASACSISRRLCVDADDPPSANSRMLGRKNSTAVFESWTRRSSSANSMCSMRADPSYASLDHLANLKLQLDGLKIQLAEAEEGRRASEACLRALKDYIANGSTGEAPISLPPLPTDPAADSYGEGANQRRESSASSLRRTSTTSTASAATFLDNRPTPSLPSFGAFSFSALVNKSSATLVDGDTSPRMSCPATLTPFSSHHHEETFPTEPSPLLSGGSSIRSRHPGRSPSASLDDAASIAPSLVSDLSSCSASSRSTSPTNEDEDDNPAAVQRSPRVVIDFVNDLEPPFVFSPDADCASQRVVVEASRMPVVMGKSSLTNLSSIAAARTTGLGLH
ncbi:proteophosphoglycan ppg1 [Rhodotorula toruloides]|uniref:Proteophosphoglycan ppg1 n=1 Tax=Rhodotorula toruloides TaxID=5286 RepID=A0A511KET9_RHOTO|nr:proteophosphoglycan ppg1 [Rhodotorula toruloides]